MPAEVNLNEKDHHFDHETRVEQYDLPSAKLAIETYLGKR
jgi:hypothetical protein